MGLSFDGMPSDSGETTIKAHETVTESDQCIWKQYCRVEHKDKDRAAGLEIAEPLILCGHQERI